jgi:hypothetical protein
MCGITVEDDRFEIRASGEVNNIELINEIYNDDYVTVSIRADIFPQFALCSASDYIKNIVTTWYNFKNGNKMPLATFTTLAKC